MIWIISQDVALSIFFKNKKWVLRSKSSKRFILTVFLVRQRWRARWKKKILFVRVNWDLLFVQTTKLFFFEWVTICYGHISFFSVELRIVQTNFLLVWTNKVFLQTNKSFFGWIGYSLERITICADK